MTAPVRIRLSRARGWRLPPDTVVVSRPSKWGNPFIVGTDGTRAECVRWYRLMLNGFFMLAGTPSIEQMRACCSHASRNMWRLKGKNLACWCALDGPCHADTLLELANAAPAEDRP